MKLDSILARNDGPNIAHEISRNRTVFPIAVTGVKQRHDEITQFRFELDEQANRWIIAYDDGTIEASQDATVPNAEDASGGRPFPHAIPEELRMAMPETIMSWGRGPESFSPMLVQHVGEHSLLITFEHKDDPAFRQTLIVDERDGIARRSMTHGQIIIITSMERIAEVGLLPPPCLDQ